jgi:hypothetical protein
LRIMPAEISPQGMASQPLPGWYPFSEYPALEKTTSAKTVASSNISCPAPSGQASSSELHRERGFFRWQKTSREPTG